MKYIWVEWKGGSTAIASEANMGSDHELTIHEKIINELYDKLKNLTIPVVIKGEAEPLICCGTCLFMDDGECNNEEPCIDFSEHVQINGL